LPGRASATPPVLTPPAPPPRPPLAHAPRDRAPSGLHIGMLEVHVTPPPATQATPSRQARQARVRTGGRAAAIARGFSVFGLGQS
jgi:hypothetical protein